MKNRTMRKKGGSCTAMSTGQYGSAVYGSSDSQQPAAGSGNLIEMKAPPQIGGKRRRERGGSAIADLGVPLILGLSAASMTCRRCRKGKKGGKSAKRRSSRRR